MANTNSREFNNSVARNIEYESTPENNVISFRERLQQPNASYPLDKTASSTPLLPKKTVSNELVAYFSSEAKQKEQEYEQLISYIEKKITLALMDYSFDSETFSPAEEAICDTVEKYSLRLLGDVLTRIYVKCYDQPNVIAGICSSLERFDANEVFPWGQSLVIGLVNHENDFVKERLISLIDNWDDISLLPALKSIDISSKWMKNYISGVIAHLEEKKCII